MAESEPREQFVAHRVNPEELRDLALLAEVRGVSRSELLRALVREEKRRLSDSDREATG